MDSVVCLQGDAGKVQTTKEMVMLQLAKKAFEGEIESDEHENGIKCLLHFTTFQLKYRVSFSRQKCVLVKVIDYTWMRYSG